MTLEDASRLGELRLAEGQAPITEGDGETRDLKGFLPDRDLTGAALLPWRDIPRRVPLVDRDGFGVIEIPEITEGVISLAANAFAARWQIERLMPTIHGHDFGHNRDREEFEGFLFGAPETGGNVERRMPLIERGRAFDQRAYAVLFKGFFLGSTLAALDIKWHMPLVHRDDFSGREVPQITEVVIGLAR